MTDPWILESRCLFMQGFIIDWATISRNFTSLSLHFVTVTTYVLFMFVRTVQLDNESCFFDWKANELSKGKDNFMTYRRWPKMS